MTVINEHDFPLLPSQEKKQRLASNNKRTRASFDDLPDELIVEILEHLSTMYHCTFRFSWLSKLALTNRRLYRIVIGQLYEGYGDYQAHPYLFLRALVLNPRLAEQVHNIHIFGTYEDPKRSYVPTAKDKKIIKEGLRATNMPSWKSWATRCNEDFRDNPVLPITMLLFTPNVTSIFHEEYRVVDPIPKPEWVDIISKAAVGAFGNVHRFKNLRSIRIAAKSSVLSNFAPLFRVQSLLRIHLQVVAEYDFSTDSENISMTDEHARELQRLIPPACNSIEELILDQCFYSEPCLDVMVASSRCLKTFKYIARTQMNWTGLDEWKWYKLRRGKSKTITEILHRHETSLETLHIFADSQVEHEAPGRIHLYENMTRFTSLKEISCPLGMIVSGHDDVFADRLPSSLMVFRTPLRRRMGDRTQLDALKHMLENCATYTPNLHEVRVDDPIRTANWYGFNKLCSKAGVKFVRERKWWDRTSRVDFIENDEDDSDDWTRSGSGNWDELVNTSSEESD